MFGLFRKKTTEAPILPPLRREQLLPRIKHVDVIRMLERSGVPPAQRPAVSPLCGELAVTYAFDLPDSVIMATPALLEEAGIAPEKMARLAAVNLEALLPPPQFFDRRGCMRAHVGQDMEAALLLIDAVWDDLVPAMHGELVVSTPRRDRLLWCDSADAQAMSALHAQTLEAFAEHAIGGAGDAHALSTQLMVRRRGGWALYGD